MLRGSENLLLRYFLSFNAYQTQHRFRRCGRVANFTLYYFVYVPPFDDPFDGEFLLLAIKSSAKRTGFTRPLSGDFIQVSLATSI